MCFEEWREMWAWDWVDVIGQVVAVTYSRRRKR